MALKSVSAACIFAFMVPSAAFADAALVLGDVHLNTRYVQPGTVLTLTVEATARQTIDRPELRITITRNGSNILLTDRKRALDPLATGNVLKDTQTIDLRDTTEPGEYRIALSLLDTRTGLVLLSKPDLASFIVIPAAAPLPYKTTKKLSAYDMLDSMGTGIGLTYQLAPDYPSRLYDRPNRNGEKEVIAALRYLGIYHIRNEGLNDDPRENALRPPPGTNAPSDFQNFLTIRAAIPGLKLNYLIQGANPHWGDGSVTDPKPVLKKLAAMGVLAAIEGPNEPNFQCALSPLGLAYTPCREGADYTANIHRLNQIWSDWGRALSALKRSDPVFANVPLLTPTLGVWGPNGPDGVETFYARAGLRDHSALYDVMAIHSYGVNGLSLGDPRGDIASGSPPTWGAYQVSIANWGRYAMPGRDVIITESGSNSRKFPAPTPSASEKAQGLALLNNYFWARYYGALRLYQYTLADDSTDLNDQKADRWGFYRGDWTPKPAADYIHRFTAAIQDDGRSDPEKIPPFTVSGQQTATWGAVMSLSKSDGSSLIMCNNTLPWYDAKTGTDLIPEPENWTITFAAPVTYKMIDVVSGEISDWRTAASIVTPVRGYPAIIHIKARDNR